MEQIVEVFAQRGGAMHVDEIAKAIVEKYPNTEEAMKLPPSKKPIIKALNCPLLIPAMD